MPYKIRKSRKTGLYKVVNADTGKVYAKDTTKEKAEAQVRLLHSLENRYQKKKKD
jgi:hypothetical protein